MIWPLWAVVRRDLLRLARQPGRLAAALARPMIWFFVIGSGVGILVQPKAPEDYQAYLVPGVLGMTLLFGATLVALSVAYDKEFGVMRMLVTAPLPQHWIVLAKIASAVVSATLQACLVLLVLGVFGFIDGSLSPSLLVAGMIGTALACAGLGMLVAVWTPTLENFALVMNFVIFPTFFLSGALYPVASLPPILKLVATINPFTYGVDLLKHAILRGESTIAAPDFSPVVDLGVLLGFTAFATVVASLRFSHEARAGLSGFLRAGR